MSNMIESAELLIYDNDGNNFGFDLSPTQLLGICKLLGLGIKGDKIICYSDKTLKILMEKTIDQFELVEFG